MAASEGHLECVKYLVERAGASVNVKDRWGSYPITDAERGKHDKVIDYLKDRLDTAANHH